MNRKLMRILETLSFVAMLACGIGVTSPALAQTASGPRGIYVPQGWATPDAETARKLGPCHSSVWLGVAGNPKAGWSCGSPP